jgi:hypothetical protein
MIHVQSRQDKPLLTYKSAEGSQCHRALEFSAARIIGSLAASFISLQRINRISLIVMSGDVNVSQWRLTGWLRERSELKLSTAV